MANRTEFVGRVRGRGDDGKVYEVELYQDWIDASDMDGPAEIKGLPSARLTDGRRCNINPDRTFSIFDTGVIIRMI